MKSTSGTKAPVSVENTSVPLVTHAHYPHFDWMDR
jgi:hypothetical protein